MRIKKIAPVTPANGNIKNSYGTSQTDTYSQEYQNKHNVVVSSTTPTTSERVWFKQGKNLLPKRGTQIISGITITEQADGSLILNGTASANVSYYYCGNDTIYESLYTIEKGGKYTLSSTTATGYFIYVMSGGSVIASLTNGGETTFTATANATYRIFIRVSSGVSLSNIHIYPQLEEGETATTYEEYIAPQIITNGTEIYSKDKKEIYDTNEVVIGTWLGKPLYRKVVDFTISSTWQDVGTFSNIDLFTKIQFVRKNTGNVYPYYQNSDNYCYAYIPSSKARIIVASSTNESGNPCNLIVEYTKTTD